MTKYNLTGAFLWCAALVWLLIINPLAGFTWLVSPVVWVHAVQKWERKK